MATIDGLKEKYINRKANNKYTELKMHAGSPTMWEPTTVTRPSTPITAPMTPEQARQSLLNTGKYESYTDVTGGAQLRLKQEYQTPTPPTPTPPQMPATPQVNVQPSATDLLIQSYLNKMLAQEQKQADFNSYIANWKPDMSQEQYINTAANAATAAQNTAYDNSVAAIKQRLANQLAGYNNQLVNLPGQYKAAYDANTQSAYNQNEAVKQTLARTGLLNSGVALGNQKQTENTYNAARQAIDLQKQQEQNDITTNINTTKSNAEADITTADLNRQNTIAQSKADAQKEYIDYVQNQKQFASDNFWKGANYNLDSQKVYNDLLGMAGNYSLGQQQLSLDAQKTNAQLQQDASQFAASQGLEYDKLSQNDKQFYANLAQENMQFTNQMAQDAEQFASTMGYNYAKLQEDGRQFDKQLGYDREELAQEYDLATKEMGNALATARIGAGYNADGSLSEKWKTEHEEWEKEYELELKGFDADKQAYYTEEAGRVSAGVEALMSKYEALLPSLSNSNNSTTNNAAKAQALQYGNQMISLVKTSGMPTSAKTTYYKTIQNAMIEAGIVTTVPTQSLSDTREGGYTK